MSYDVPFHRIVMIGTTFTDTFNVTVAYTPGGGSALPAVSPALATSVGSAIATWWALPLAASGITGGLSIGSSSLLTSVKVNRIGTNGLYMDPDTQEYVLPTPVGGIGSTRLIPQLSLVATLRGSDERAKAGKGRMYFPASNLTVPPLDTAGLVAAAEAQKYANGMISFFNRIQGAYSGLSLNAVAGITSKAGTGAHQTVAKVTVGRVVDTMRSRRSKLVEDPVEATF